VLLTRKNDQAGTIAADGRPLDHVLWQQGREVAEQYKIPGTPGAVLVRHDGTIASLVALGRSAIERLLFKADG
jgi:hypothetical protein